MKEIRVSKSGWLALLAPVFVIATAVTCSNDDNNVTSPLPALTPTPGVNPTPTPSGGGSMSASVNVGAAGGGMVFMDQASGNSTSTIAAGGTVNWVWVDGTHSTTSGTCPAAGGECTPDGNWDSPTASGITFSHTFPTAGTFHYFCRVHDSMMQGMVVVQ
jgi:plastocyanin